MNLTGIRRGPTDEKEQHAWTLPARDVRIRRRAVVRCDRRDGVQSCSLGRGATAWGRGGDIPGRQTRTALGPDGAAVTIAVTAVPRAIIDPSDETRLLASSRLVLNALDAVLCDQ